MDKIVLSGMSFYGHHGVSAAEREVGHHLEVDVELELDLTAAGQSDDLADTADYKAIYEIIEDVITNSSFRLLEALAEEMAARLLRSQLVEKVTLRVKKVKPPITGQVESAAVEITRGR